MSRTRRNFNAKFKSDLVLEVLKGEKELNVIATENGIQANLLRNWKKEFLEKASVVFDDTREENLKEKLTEERKEKAAYAKKAGQFTSQEYKEFLKENHVRQSMDGKSRWADNIRIERWFRSFKYEEAYLTEWHNIKEARDAA